VSEPTAISVAALLSISGGTSRTKARVVIDLHLLPPNEDIQFQLLVSLPAAYPNEAPPQLQLLSRYIGAFGVDASLFGTVIRTFISSNGVPWTHGNVCVFDGLEMAIEICSAWYINRLDADFANELQREEDRKNPSNVIEQSPSNETVDSSSSTDSAAQLINVLPPEVTIIVAEPIVDRKSSFIGRACRISDPSQVPIILSFLLSDRRIARAAHPIINAWRCRVGATLHQDNDDDGETAAGGRLAHLLQILEVDNVLVVVTRYFGGIHLGPDRFKHINQAGRNALELGGFLTADDEEKRAINKRGKR